MRRRRAFAAASIAALVTLAPAASAQGAPAGPSISAPRGVSLTVSITGSASDADALEASLRDYVAAVDGDITFVRGTSSAAAEHEGATRAVVAVDMTSAAEWRIVVTGGSAADARGARVLPRDPSPSVAREEIAYAVRSSIDAVIGAPARGRETAAPKSEPAPTPQAAGPEPVVQRPSPPHPARRETSFAVDVAPFGTVRSFGGDAVSPGLGAAVGLAFGRGTGALSLWITGAYHLPFEAGTQQQMVHGTVSSLRLLPTLELLASDRFLVDLGIGAGVDRIEASGRRRDMSVPPFPDAHDLAFPLGALATVHTRVVGDTDVMFGLGIDVDFATHRYGVRNGDADRPLFEMSNVRPYITLGLSFSLFGGERFSPR